MHVTVRAYRPEDLPAMRNLWNAVVERGNAFPQCDPLTPDEAAAFFAGQSYAAVAETDGRVVGVYILHPNNVGRCGHLANASYAVDAALAGQGIGRQLVSDSLVQAKRLGFRVLQFNAVVSSNAAALHLYDSLGFVRVGTVPGGFRNRAGTYEDIVLMYRLL